MKGDRVRSGLLMPFAYLPKNLNEPKETNLLVTKVGIEPTLTVYKTAVLPLNYPV